MAKRKSNSTTPAAPAPPGDNTGSGPFDIPSEWLPAEWVADRQVAEAKLKRQRAIIDRANNAEAIWHEGQLKELRAIREALTERGGTQSGRIREMLREVLYPTDGKAPANLSYTAIRAVLCKEFKKRHWKLPDRKTVKSVVDEIGRR